MVKMLRTVVACTAALGVALTLAARDSAQAADLSLATPGVPPIFAAVNVYVAQKEGFFKKYGAHVKVRPFDTGTAAARAVLAGDVDIAMSPTPVVIKQVSNAGVPLVGVFGMNPVDWILATTLPGKTCKSVIGHSVGVDAVGGARSVALHGMLARGCPGVKLSQVKQVALGSNTATAMIAGTLSYGVLHLSDVAQIEAQGKKVYTLLAARKVNPLSHHILYVVRKDRLAANRKAYVRAVAAIIAANRFMQNPKNFNAVAKIATVTGLSESVAKAALKKYLAIHSWSTKTDGMNRAKIVAVAKLLKKVGAIKPGKQPVSFNKLIDPSVWKDAMALVNAHEKHASAK